MASNSPQAKQMVDESMSRTLSAQASAIWPQEVELLRAYKLPASLSILDLGCGPGQISKRLLSEFPQAQLLGIDIEPVHVDSAAAHCQEFSERSEFRVGNALRLEAVDDNCIDLALCRHVLQAVPHAEQVVQELCRVTRPGGRLHLLAEDYGMITFYPTQLDCDAFWRKGPMVFAQKTNTDLQSGRKMYTLLHELGLSDVSVSYVQVDTHRVPREVFAAIWTAWRDGFSEIIAQYSEYDYQQVLAYWNDMIACIESPKGYGLWSIPVVSGIVR